MTSGKFDEELLRMSSIVDHLKPGSLVLFNESFASTNEREGSQIAREIVRALLESGVRVVLVTHMYDLSGALYTKHSDDALFLRADREDGGRRTFKLVNARPLPTGYGQDLYEQVFGADSAIDEAAVKIPVEWRQPAAAQRPTAGATP